MDDLRFRVDSFEDWYITITDEDLTNLANAVKVLYFSVRKATKRRVQMMDAYAKVYITKDYSVKLNKNDIKGITRDVRLTLYESRVLMIIPLPIF